MLSIVIHLGLGGRGFARSCVTEPMKTMVSIMQVRCPSYDLPSRAIDWCSAEDGSKRPNGATLSHEHHFDCKRATISRGQAAHFDQACGRPTASVSWKPGYCGGPLAWVSSSTADLDACLVPRRDIQRPSFEKDTHNELRRSSPHHH